MAIPTVENLLLPLLRGLGDGQVHHIREFRERLSDEFGLTEDEREELLPSGQRMIICLRYI